MDDVAGPAIAVCPVQARGTDRALRVVSSFLVGTADYTLHSHNCADGLLLKEFYDFAVDLLVESHIALR